jgi:TonB family protein
MISKLERSAIVVIVAIFFLPVIVRAQTSVEDQLRQKYVGSERMLRHFFAADTLKFDESGNPLNPERTGSWTLFGAVAIDKLTLSSKKLELQGHRAIVTIDDSTRTMKRLNWKEKVWIQIPVASQADASGSQLQSALDKVFVTPGEEMVRALPDYWQEYMARLFDKQLQGPPCQDSNPHSTQGDSAANTTNASEGPTPKSSVGIAEGHLLHRVEPNYFRVAKEAGVQGEIKLRAVISKAGDVTQLCINQAIGGGMDDEAVNTARQWKYTPYLLNGQAVEIKTSISFKFHMN